MNFDSSIAEAVTATGQALLKSAIKLLIEVEGQLVTPPRSGKSIVVNGNRYRMRRGKLVKIPSQWVGRFPTEATIRQRPSKTTKKRRRDEKTGNWRGSATAEQLMLKNGAKSIEDEALLKAWDKLILNSVY